MKPLFVENLRVGRRQMSWPHILSFSRVIAGPVVAALVLSPPGDSYLIGGLLFGAASLTDLLDGKLARHAQRESPLGVFLDTTSDKILVSLTLIGMAIALLVPAWMVLIIIGREFLISGLRSFAASCNRIISAHIWGKGKAALTMVATGCVLLAADGRAGGALSHIGTHGEWQSAYTACSWLLGAATVLTIGSGLRYVADAWPLLRPQSEVEIAEPARPRIVAGGDGQR
jgi:CDP-diacylglycerol--glycerol-3-phosphate 3-phosphatidyltransferase